MLETKFVRFFLKKKKISNLIEIAQCLHKIYESFFQQKWINHSSQQILKRLNLPKFSDNEIILCNGSITKKINFPFINKRVLWKILG